MSGLDKKTIGKIRKRMKFVNQWFFIAMTRQIVKGDLEHANILKMATGKFVPWSQAKKWYSFVNAYIHSIKHPLQIFSGVI